QRSLLKGDEPVAETRAPDGQGADRTAGSARNKPGLDRCARKVLTHGHARGSLGARARPGRDPSAFGIHDARRGKFVGWDELGADEGRAERERTGGSKVVALHDPRLTVAVVE